MTGNVTGNISGNQSGGTVSATSVAVSDLTSGRVVLAGASGELEDDNSLTFNSTSNLLSVAGNIQVSDKIIHTGDTNTVIRFPADDTFTVETDGVERLRILSDGKVRIPDTGKFVAGDSDDLQIYHNGFNSVIQDSGTGSLFFISNKYRFRNAADDEDLATFTENGAVELFYDNAKKLETKSDGVDVTGNLVISGNVSVGGTLSYTDVTDIDSVGLITARQGIDVTGGDIKVGAGFTVGQAGIVTANQFVSSSTTLPFYPPVMTTTQRDAMTVNQGAMIFNSTSKKMEFYDGTSWQSLPGMSLGLTVALDG